MNKYRIKTIEEKGKFIGYVLNNDEVIYSSSPQETSTLASIQVTKYINELTSNSFKQPTSITSDIHVPTSEPVTVSRATSVVPEPPPRRCCGRS